MSHMETRSSPSPGHSVLAPRPWTSFKDTPPSPLLVLRKKEGVKYRAPHAPLSPAQRKSSKRRAPAPPVRSSSLKDSEDEEDIDGVKEVTVNKVEASPKVTIDLGEASESSQSFKNEVSIFVFPENGSKELESDLHGEDSQDGVRGPEIILDVSKLESSLDEAIEDFGDAINDLKEDNVNDNIDQETEAGRQDKSELNSPLDLGPASDEAGRKLTIKGWEKFVEGIYFSDWFYV